MSFTSIGIDASNIRHGGGRTHLVELLIAADLHRNGFSEVFVWGSKDTLGKLPNYSWLKKMWTPALEGGLLRRILWQRFSLGKAAHATHCNVLFVPGGSFNTSFRPVVTMSQNILPFEWSELLRYGISLFALKLILLRFTQSQSFHRADGVIFLTDYAKRGVLRVTGVLKGEISVIPHGLNSRFLTSTNNLSRRKLPIKHDTIRLIYVSIIDQYKHQWHVVDAVAKARVQSGLDLQLDLVGPAFSPALKRLNAAIDEHDPHGTWVHYRGAVDYQELHSLYAQAHIGIWASSCETFGLILLEMMAAGLPILSSDRGPMPEILGDAGLYFDPEKPDSLCEGLLGLLGTEEEMWHLSLAAYKKAKTYSWARCATETFKFLHQISDSKALGKNAESLNI